MIQLQHNQVACRHIDGVNLPFPVTVGTLLADNSVVQPIAERLPQIIPLTINHLAVVQIGVMPMSESACAIANVVK